MMTAKRNILNAVLADFINITGDFSPDDVPPVCLKNLKIKNMSYVIT